MQKMTYLVQYVVEQCLHASIYKVYTRDKYNNINENQKASKKSSCHFSNSVVAAILTVQTTLSSIFMWARNIYFWPAMLCRDRRRMSG